MIQINLHQPAGKIMRCLWCVHHSQRDWNIINNECVNANMQRCFSQAKSSFSCSQQLQAARRQRLPLTDLRMQGWWSRFMSCTSLSMLARLLPSLFIFRAITWSEARWWTWKTAATTGWVLKFILSLWNCGCGSEMRSDWPTEAEQTEQQRWQINFAILLCIVIWRSNRLCESRGITIHLAMNTACLGWRTKRANKAPKIVLTHTDI